MKNLGNSTKAYALWQSAVRYFAENEWAFAMFHKIVSNKKTGSAGATPSLRCILYYITKFVQANASLSRDDDPTDIYEQYRCMLRVHTKHLFDPFCRRTRYELKLHGHTIYTNIGQITFFRWFIHVGAYENLTAVYDDVISDMKLYNTRRKLTKDKLLAKKRGALAPPGKKTATLQRKSDKRTRVVVRLAVQCNRDIRIAVHLD